jgi:hypothetical protein
VSQLGVAAAVPLFFEVYCQSVLETQPDNSAGSDSDRHSRLLAPTALFSVN